MTLAADPTPAEVQSALRKAVEFYHWEVSSHGGYVYRYSSDLTFRRGEAVVEKSRVWVQPPGTPFVGEAFLNAYDATNDPYTLDAARDTGYALCKGQMKSGGWTYFIEFDPALRPNFGYRDIDRPKSKERSDRYTTLDDDTTQAATRFLMRLDQTLKFEDPRIHDAAIYALSALVGAQFPNGGWPTWWVEFPKTAPDPNEYPVIPASVPETWSRTWTKDFTGCYVTNDDLMSDMIDTMLLAHRIYQDDRYLSAARKAGDFLILAQMPDPQPAWAQQYDTQMHPVWSRKFEPPAVSGGESQEILLALMRLYAATGDEKYLKPIPRALAYLKSSTLPDGRLARFYEMKTNKPLYFTKDYQLTDNPSDMPTHYGFILDSRLDRIATEFDRVKRRGTDAYRPSTPKLTPALTAQVRQILDAQDPRGAWLDRANNGSPIIESATFSKNLDLLSQFLRASR